MKIAIISDIHDNLPNLEKTLDYCQKNNIKKIICCGDFGTERTFDKLAGFSGEIFTVLGNMDEDHVEFEKIKNKYPSVRVWETYGEVVLDGKVFGFTHEPQDARAAINQSAGKYNLYFYGHTHKPWEETIGQARLINPGNLANVFYKPTFAVYDTKTDLLELKILEQL